MPLKQVDVWACLTGPGSFTGLRVGLAAMKGISQALNHKLLGVDALTLAALSADQPGQFLVLVENQGDNLFAGLRQVDEKLEVRQLRSDVLESLENILQTFSAELLRPTWLIKIDRQRKLKEPVEEFASASLIKATQAGASLTVFPFDLFPTYTLASILALYVDRRLEHFSTVSKLAPYYQTNQVYLKLR